MRKRIGSLDLVIFAGTLVLTFYHAGQFYNHSDTVLCGSGYLVYDLLFLVAGCCLNRRAKQKAESKKAIQETLGLVRDYYARVLPFLVPAVLMSNLFSALGRFALQTFGINLLGSLTEISGLELLGFPGYFATGTGWFLSAVLIVSFAIYPFLCKSSTRYTCWIGPLSALAVLGYLARVDGSLNADTQWGVVLGRGLLRGYAAITLGCVAFEIAQWLNRETELSAFCSALLQNLELWGYAAAFAYMILDPDGGPFDFLMVGLLFCAVTVTFSKYSVFRGLFQERRFGSLQMLGLSLLLNQVYVRDNLMRIFPDLGRLRMLCLYLACVGVLSVVNYGIGSFLSKKGRGLTHIRGMIVIFVLLCVVTAYSAPAVSGMQWMMSGVKGSGTEADPYQIETSTQLSAFRNRVNSGTSFEGQFLLQTEDIDLEDEEWIPIGLSGSKKYFCGTYDGGNHVIQGLQITPEGGVTPAHYGFFGMLNGTVKNLGIASGIVSGRYVGAITCRGAGAAARIINCYNQAEIRGKARAGGICDIFTGGTVINCVNFGTVEGKIAGQIISQDARLVAAIYPEENGIAESFTGYYMPVAMEGDTVEELLNSGLEQLFTTGTLTEQDAAMW